MGKYNFDEVVNREKTYSSKWALTGWTRDIYGGDLPDDRICLHVADMDFKCAPKIVEAMHRVACDEIYGYSSIPSEYYDAVTSWYERRMGWKFNRDSIFYAPGTHTAIAECIRRFTKLDDYVVVLTPSYSYHMDIEGTGRHYLAVDMINNEGYYTIDFAELESACKMDKVSAMIICHPHNPTGRVYNEDELKNIAEICRRYNVLMISDEVHSDLVRHDVKFTPMMKAVGPEGLIVTTAVNKTFNLAGLQMTNMIIEDPKLKEGFKTYHSSPTPFGIASVIAAYNESEDWVDELNLYLDSLIDECINYIRTNIPKCKVYRPEGTYILWLDFREYLLWDSQIKEKICNNARVITQGGASYDEPWCGQFQRLCIASPKEKIMEALERIAKEFN